MKAMQERYMYVSHYKIDFLVLKFETKHYIAKKISN